MLAYYAIVKDAAVETIVHWTGQPGWTPPTDAKCIALPEGSAVQPGWDYDEASGKFTDPAETTAEEKE